MVRGLAIPVPARRRRVCGAGDQQLRQRSDRPQQLPARALRRDDGLCRQPADSAAAGRFPRAFHRQCVDKRPNHQDAGRYRRIPAVALTEEDAKRAGLDPRSLNYDVSVQTANGKVMVASVVLDRIDVKGIVVRDVHAMVSQDDFPRFEPARHDFSSTALPASRYREIPWNSSNETVFSQPRVRYRLARFLNDRLDL